ncbi:MAG: Hsp20/alpha crystallin family protein [Gammaproteobacteria bacterium]|nr:MAG: Hsp20/alpha crystallin family protein [Gammaproteobacteria bacterium]
MSTLMKATNPWRLLDEFNREFSRMLPGFADDDSQVVGSTWAPAVDIKEEDDKFVIRADIPGVSPDDIDVSMEQGVLTIKGERKHEAEENKEGYHRIERAYGTFMRRFALPENVDADKISATSKDGVLELVLPKAQQGDQPRKIKVEG